MELGDRSLFFETLQEHLEEQAELREGLENMYAKEAMEAEQFSGQDGGSVKKLNGIQVAALKTKVGKGRTRYLSMFDFDMNAMKEMQDYIQELGDAPNEFGEVAKGDVEDYAGRSRGDLKSVCFWGGPQVALAIRMEHRRHSHCRLLRTCALVFSLCVDISPCPAWPIAAIYVHITDVSAHVTFALLGEVGHTPPRALACSPWG